MLVFLRVLEKAQSKCSQSKHGLYGHVTPNFTARRTRETALKKRWSCFSRDVLLPGEIFAGQEGHPLASPISMVTLN